MKRKSLLALVLTLVLSLMLAACGGNETATQSSEGGAPADTGETFVLKAGHSLPDTHPYELALLEVAKNVEERTEGRVKIETFPNSQIGAERELTEGLTLGTVDIVVSSTAPITNFVPDLGVLDLPFLFDSREKAVEVLNGEIGQELFDKIGEQGIMAMSWGENGYRHITNAKRPVTTPEDLKGLKIRTQENQYHLAAFEALGAQPTPMAWTEALTGLQQGVVDAQENPIIVADQFNLFESNQKYMTLTGHVYSVAIYMLSQATYDKLPEDLREIVVDELVKAGPFERDLLVKMDQESLEKVKAQGMEVIEEVDVAPFREAITSVYDKYDNQDLLNRILEAQK
ncbi:TRAP transporter substrate-binding protein [Calidifontibacillus oryziterrae]|uniref:TRAP transporter substrate-binding protein n=1 Tax=Calidifontibacillus oryziterrae TaxID=1191699 RepID=UPI0002F47371|nr:TRAP transporter substrate-binding protein [Calidifontibacillus oryziterrae]